MKMEKRKTKLNNKGLSLIEVIIAIIILTVVIVPTMKMFASSASFNSQARKNMRAITVAEGVMENFKAYSMEDLCKQFDATYTTDVFTGITGQTGTTEYKVFPKNATGAVVSALFNTETGKLNQEATQYCFLVSNGLEEGKMYDVKVNVEKREEEEVLQTDPINKYTDAIVEIPESFTGAVCSKLVESAPTYLTANASPSGAVAGTIAMTKLEIKELNRTMKVECSSGTSDAVGVVVQYDYKSTIHYTYMKNSVGMGVSSQTATLDMDGTLYMNYDGTVSDASVENSVYSNAASGVALKNLYFYYYPLYADSSLGIAAASDKIVINNSIGGGRVINANIARQKSSSYPDSLFSTLEQGYKLDVSATGTVTLKHNDLSKSLADPADTIFGGCTPSGFSECKTFAEGTKGNKRLLYNVTVLVYNGGTIDMTNPTGGVTDAQALATFSATMND